MKSTPALRPGPAQRAYLAGIIDGEGWIGAYISSSTREGGRRERGIQIRISIANTDRRLVDWIAEFWAGRIAPLKATRTRKLCWYFHVNGDDMAVMLADVRPFLVIKREQAEVAWELLQTRRKPGGYAYSPEQWARKRVLVARLAELNKRGPADGPHAVRSA